MALKATLQEFSNRSIFFFSILFFFVQVLLDYLDFLIMNKVPVLLDLYSPYYKGCRAPKQLLLKQ